MINEHPDFTGVIYLPPFDTSLPSISILYYHNCVGELTEEDIQEENNRINGETEKIHKYLKDILKSCPPETNADEIVEEINVSLQ